MPLKFQKTEGRNFLVLNAAKPTYDIQTVYDAIYPVGIKLIRLEEPLVPAGVSATWKLDNTYNNRSLWINNSEGLGTLVEGSLPNIEGSQTINSAGIDGIRVNVNGSGAMKHEEDMNTGSCLSYHAAITAAGYNPAIVFDASLVDKVYTGEAKGKENYGIVRPTSVVAHVWKREA